MSTYCRNRASEDCPNLLKRALNSILNQTFHDFELILIDDGSKDGTEAVCREYVAKDSRIRYVRNDINSGFPAKRYNEGMLLAKSNYLMYMFDDDIWYPNAIEDLYKAITNKHKDCGMVYGLGVIKRDGYEDYIGGEWDMAHLEYENFLFNLAVIVKREVINIVGGYDESEVMRRSCDWDLWYRIGKKFPVARITIPIGEWSKQPDGVGQIFQFDYKAMRNMQRNPKREVPLKGKLQEVV
jgi:glycosyltransferase involved in cell wall biosynthesis